MTYLLKILIQIYWLVPAKYKRKCLYKESCSKHVYRVNSEKGFKESIKALRKRIKYCQPNYCLMNIEGQRVLIHQDGNIIQNEQLADWLRN